MSTVRVDNYSDRLGSFNIPAIFLAQGTAKAWMNLNATGTAAIRDSFGVSSITDITTGTFEANFATAMPNANYAPVFGGNDAIPVGVNSNSAIPTTAKVKFICFNGALVDPLYATMQIMGDPA